VLASMDIQNNTIIMVIFNGWRFSSRWLVLG
jgi:hypothetical protein